MFGSNVQPKKFGKDTGARENWSCLKCSSEVRNYLAKCPYCGARREN